MTRLLAAIVLSWCAGVTPVRAADLRPETVAAFDRYVRLTEQRMARDTYDTLATRPRHELFIEPVVTRERGREIDVPDGLIHHWVGAVFVRGATLNEAVALLQDYDRHQRIYQPTVERSKVLSRDGDTFKVYLRFMMKKVITVVVNSEHEARFRRDGSDRARSRIVSTRIAEVDEPGTPGEREKPVGRDGGYLWRLNTYWRFLQRDNGVYVECESITLTRAIPAGFGWLIRPFVTSLPRESLTFTLERTRTQLSEDRAQVIQRPAGVDRSSVPDAALGAHDGSARRPPEERTRHKCLDDVVAGARFQPPEARRLGQGQLKARHFQELATDATEKRC